LHLVHSPAEILVIKRKIVASCNSVGRRIRHGLKLVLLLLLELIALVSSGTKLETTADYSEPSGTWRRWITTLPDQFIVMLEYLMDLTRSNNCTSTHIRLYDVPIACLVKVQDREKQASEVVVVGFFIEAQTLNIGISLSELVYK
jgi:hypothetical protein